MHSTSSTTAPPGVLGIDFGTSNSAVAWAAPGAPVRAIALEGAATALPTALFFNAEDDSVHFGRDAVAQYLSGVDGRLMRSLKSLLGSPLLQEQTVVNGRQMSFQDIITRFLFELRQRAASELGQALPRTVVMGRPVHFVDDDAERDALAQATLLDCARQAGFTEVSFQLEPIAAALDYEQRVAAESLVLVTDIGGGTSDFSVVRLGPERLAHAAKKRRQANPRADDILASTGVHIGGTDFDQRLNLSEVMPLLGHRHVGPLGREVPSAVFHDLATWHLIHWRYSAKAMREAQSLRPNYADTRLHDRLMRVLDDKLGHHNAHEVEQAKIACSRSGAPARLDLHLVEKGLSAEFSAEAMAQQLKAPLAQVIECAQECLRRAGVRAQDLDCVYLTGGSSALKPFQQALAAGFPGTRLVEGDLFGGVAAGLASQGMHANGSLK